MSSLVSKAKKNSDFLKELIHQTGLKSGKRDAIVKVVTDMNLKDTFIGSSKQVVEAARLNEGVEVKSYLVCQVMR